MALVTINGFALTAKESGAAIASRLSSNQKT
jgi:hypothetical protein